MSVLALIVAAEYKAPVAEIKPVDIILPTAVITPEYIGK